MKYSMTIDDLPRDRTFDSCLRLWASVMRTAADDMHSKGIVKAQAIAWFLCEEDGVGTFLWCCDALSIDPEWVREAVRNREVKKSAGRYASMLISHNKV